MTDRLEPAELTQLASEIVAAYVTGDPLPAADLPQLIDLVAERLRGLGHAPGKEAAPSKPAPVVPVRPDATCLVCGKTQKTLRRHLATAHVLTAAAYREMFELKPDYPMVAPNYSRQRSEMARRLGLGQRRPPPRRRSLKGNPTSGAATEGRASDQG